MRALPFLLLACALPAQERHTDTFLQLDRTQRQTITRNNAEHERWREQKERRIYQVRSEINDETNRSPLDPTALGLRHAEVESICREIDERETQLVQANRNALAEPQKVKLAALEEAMRLVPIANAAVQGKLIAAAPAIFQGVIGAQSPVIPSSGILFIGSTRTGACANTRIITNPFFTPTPNTTSP